MMNCVYVKPRWVASFIIAVTEENMSPPNYVVESWFRIFTAFCRDMGINFLDRQHSGLDKDD